MKLGFVSSILEDYDFEELVDIASDMGYQCIEVACWPQGKAERRYAGVSHLDVDNLTDSKVSYIKDYCNSKNIEISSLAYYPNTMDGNLNKRKENIEHLRKVIAASAEFKINLVTTFIGRDQNKTVEENIELFKEIWPPIIRYAEEKGVKIAIENCPMLFGADQWPGGQNLFTSPKIWRKLFEIIPNENFGINLDPSHFVWQMMDYILPIYEFKDRIFHVHFKDIKLDVEQLKNVGIMAYPLEYMRPKLPGLGDVDWGAYVSALTDIGYNGYSCIEIEDRAFEGSKERVLDSLRISKKYLEQFVI
ncbi:sugar phosphate isomerase/epimerase [Halocella sp. SP3-1]|uniref:sugar phosphate isomerase/epimerase family protein n=1 Tax=Halocella sp. SP3-1 TaxID=2382161 RepID=UPI000F75599F|nr:sugar phosphate isomerase/epimerase [Halocella sp. SP3-1]AZO96304.1 sugar phosphate isomerase/epimerase [Halocella sp. SP3-1]